MIFKSLKKILLNILFLRCIVFSKFFYTDININLISKT
jgi:hypothetical protein